MMFSINVEAENEHFDICDSVISWMEAWLETSNTSRRETKHESPPPLLQTGSESIINNEETIATNLLRDIGLPPSAAHHQLSAPGMAWNLVKIFSEKHGVFLDSGDVIQDPSSSSIATYESISSDPNVLSVEKSPPSPENNFLQLSSDPREVMMPIININTSTTTETNHSPAQSVALITHQQQQEPNSHTNVRLRGNDEWAPPRAQIIFNIHKETQFSKSMLGQNYRCAGCGTKIDLELARRLVLYCHYLGKYFCKCCFSHKAIHLPGYILQKWDFHKYQVSHFALQLLDRMANEPLFNINDINPSLYRKVKKLRQLVDIRMQLYYLKIYISTCTQTDQLHGEYTAFTHQHLLQDDVHLYSLNNLIEIQHGKLYEYLNDLVTRSISHIAQCDRCRAKGHYCQLCGPSSLISSMILNTTTTATTGGDHMTPKENSAKLKHSHSVGQNIHSTNVASTKTPELVSRPQLQQQHQGNHSRSSSGNYSNFTVSTNLSTSGVCATTSPTMSVNIDDHELIFPFEIGRVAQCRICGCCFHLQCFLNAGQNCPKCERIQRRKAEMVVVGGGGGANVESGSDRTIAAAL